MRELINKLKTPEISGKKIGLFRIVCAIFGGAIIALLIVSVILTIIPTNKEPMTIASIILDGSIWAIVAFWISLSVSKYITLLRCMVPIFILGLILTIIY
ncbi:hypothetical protein N5T63_02565 [Aliarcobacter cryaerophilus]|uniref:hypothetical protein n=1 Tax=Aliarcobacter cryaerophilus TaxID=28198 RepID=UPI001654A741|nr:hypothetical protein [Aliarcobacter cryaerophilus]MCT7487786.1 hypothetical protein [Aliarcobacter cryaerophilus]QNM88808.1 hypothetical protein HOO41_03705 [Aliarcobacter cryaerophilus]